jgi:hypothetical protein
MTTISQPEVAVYTEQGQDFICAEGVLEHSARSFIRRLMHIGPDAVLWKLSCPDTGHDRLILIDPAATGPSCLCATMVSFPLIGIRLVVVRIGDLGVPERGKS